MAGLSPQITNLVIILVMMQVVSNASGNIAYDVLTGLVETNSHGGPADADAHSRRIHPVQRDNHLYLRLCALLDQ